MEYVVQPNGKNDPILHFQELCKIPHGSGNEKAISDYVAGYGRNLGLWTHQDELNNVYIKRPGQGKGAKKDPVILQGHLDMVCEKNLDTAFDFEKDSLNLYVEDGWLKARGTTLGADDGVAVAYMMALLAEEGDFPPLECLFTTGEETGLFGAAGADMDLFDGMRMVNLDCGPEGAILVSSAGGLRTVLERGISRGEARGQGVRITVSGLAGGHSGGDIDKERGNANKLMARVLYALSKEAGAVLVSMDGGDKDNAIPRECVAYVDAGDATAAIAVAEEMGRCFAAELAGSDSGVAVTTEVSQLPMAPMTQRDSEALIQLLYLLPCGPFHRNLVLDGLVVNSINLAVVRTQPTHLTIDLSARSSEPSLRDELMYQVELLSALLGVTCTHSSAYPGWAYDPDSPLRELAVEVYRERCGSDPEVMAIHAGLECGLLREKKPGLDIIAIGPNHEKIHTPWEMLDLASFQSTFEYLKALLAAMCK